MIKIIWNKCLVLSLFIISSAQASQSLTATIIGSGSPIYNEKRASASVLISNGETNILVDMGNGTQANLHKIGVPTSSLSSLLLTHHHLDHNEEFVPLLIGLLMSDHDVNIIGPENTAHFTDANLNLYKEDIEYRLGRTNRTLIQREKGMHITELKGGEQFKIGDINVSTLAVPHTIASIAYRFDYAGQSLLVTGDLTYSDELPNFAKEVDYMIIDSGGMVMKTNPTKQQKNRKGADRHQSKRAHLNLSDSSLLAAKAGVKNLVYTHFLQGNIDTQKSLKQIRNHYQGPVIFAEDLMVLNQA
ncbi:MAG: MBL fold metallo-hydrolase, partial [Psychromonas sp.]